MKSILITGSNSYIGRAVRQRLESEPEFYSVDEISVRGDDWKRQDFSQYDAVLHVAGIAHVSTDPSMEGEYYRVNRDLAIAVARKAKAEGVKQFLLTSSAIVYGDSSASVGTGITPGTKPSPANFYGKSKLEAERGVSELEDGQFKVAIMRLPMVYGPGCKGNFPSLASIARRCPVFPSVGNRRSVVYIGNLTEFVAALIMSGEGGLFWPQNADYFDTGEAIRMLGQIQGRKVSLLPALRFVSSLACRFTRPGRKAFGSLWYSHDACDCRFNEACCKYSFEESLAEYCAQDSSLCGDAR